MSSIRVKPISILLSLFVQEQENRVEPMKNPLSRTNYCKLYYCNSNSIFVVFVIFHLHVISIRLVSPRWLKTFFGFLF